MQKSFLPARVPEVNRVNIMSATFLHMKIALERVSESSMVMSTSMLFLPSCHPILSVKDLPWYTWLMI
jgi:hypothetical protein